MVRREAAVAGRRVLGLEVGDRVERSIGDLGDVVQMGLAQGQGGREGAQGRRTGWAAGPGQRLGQDAVAEAGSGAGFFTYARVMQICWWSLARRVLGPRSRQDIPRVGTVASSSSVKGTVSSTCLCSCSRCRIQVS